MFLQSIADCDKKQISSIQRMDEEWRKKKNHVIRFQFSIGVNIYIFMQPYRMAFTNIMGDTFVLNNSNVHFSANDRHSYLYKKEAAAHTAHKSV